MQLDSDSKHKSNVSLKIYIYNNIKVIKWPPYNLELNPIENFMGNIKRYLEVRIYQDIKSLKEDVWDQ